MVVSPRAKRWSYLLAIPVIILAGFALFTWWKGHRELATLDAKEVGFGEVGIRNDPIVVTVDVTGRAVVLVTGEVLKPGAYDVGGLGSVTISRLIEMAGGTTDFADRDQIEVHCRGGENILLSYDAVTNFDAATLVLIRLNKKFGFQRKSTRPQ